MKYVLAILIAITLLSTRHCGAQDLYGIDTAKYRKLRTHVHDIRVSMYYAGEELNKYTNNFYIGAGLQIGGAALIGAGAAGQITPAIYLGGLIMLIGTGVELISHNHIHFAGMELQAAGLAIPID